MSAGSKGVARWPLLIIAAPAAVAVWSGWVGLGSMCGFGLVMPLPGMVSWHLDTAITLPVGIEAYGSYALGAWIRFGDATGPVASRARTFARRSSVGALALGMTGQVIYHLLAAAHAVRAPWPVIVLVACLPVVSLGFGAGLIHLCRAAADEIAEATAAREDARAQRMAARQARTGGAAAARLGPYSGPDGALVPYGSAPYSESRTDGSDPVRVPAVRVSTPRDQRPGTDIDREALVTQLAAEIVADPAWRPDYPALQQQTGCKRSYCEKLVREARAQAARTAAEPGARTDGQLAGSLA